MKLYSNLFNKPSTIDKVLQGFDNKLVYEPIKSNNKHKT